MKKKNQVYEAIAVTVEPQDEEKKANQVFAAGGEQEERQSWKTVSAVAVVAVLAIVVLLVLVFPPPPRDDGPENEDDHPTFLRSHPHKHHPHGGSGDKDTTKFGYDDLEPKMILLFDDEEGDHPKAKKHPLPPPPKPPRDHTSNPTGHDKKTQNNFGYDDLEPEMVILFDPDDEDAVLPNKQKQGGMIHHLDPKQHENNSNNHNHHPHPHDPKSSDRPRPWSPKPVSL